MDIRWEQGARRPPRLFRFISRYRYLVSDEFGLAPAQHGPVKLRR